MSAWSADELADMVDFTAESMVEMADVVNVDADGSGIAKLKAAARKLRRDAETPDRPTGRLDRKERLYTGKGRWEELTTAELMLLVERWAKSARTDLECGDPERAVRWWEGVKDLAEIIWQEMQDGEATVEFDPGHRGDPEREPAAERSA